MEHEITIIVPVYNAEKYLKTCIESIINQSFQNWLLLLVDDGSTDESREICDQYSAKDSRIKVIHKENGGSASARNVGLDNVSSDFVSMIDADDCVPVDYLEFLLDTLKSNDSDIVGHLFRGFTDDTELEDFRISDIEGLKVTNYTRDEAIEKLIGPHHTSYIVPMKLYRASVFDGLRYPNVKKNDDEWLIHHLLLNIRRMSIIEERIYYYRFSTGSQTRSFSEDNFSAVLATIDRIKALSDAGYSSSITPLYLRLFDQAEEYYAKCKINHIDPRKQLASIKNDLTLAIKEAVIPRKDLYSRKEIFLKWLFANNLCLYSIFDGLNKRR